MDAGPLQAAGSGDLLPAAADGCGFLRVAERIAVNHAIHDRVERGIVRGRRRSSRHAWPGCSREGELQEPIYHRCHGIRGPRNRHRSAFDLVFPAVGVLLAFEGQAGAHRDSFATSHAGNSDLAPAQLLLEDIAERPACVNVAIMKRDEIARTAVAVKKSADAQAEGQKCRRGGRELPAPGRSGCSKPLSEVRCKAGASPSSKSVQPFREAFFLATALWRSPHPADNSKRSL